MPPTAQTIDAPLDRLVRHVVEVMRPREIWLFGSRAEDRARPTSDYDLLVVMPDETPEPELDPARAWRLGWEARVTADIVPCIRSELDEEKDELDSLPRAAVLRGREIASQLVSPRPPLRRWGAVTWRTAVWHAPDLRLVRGGIVQQGSVGVKPRPSAPGKEPQVVVDDRAVRGFAQVR